MKKITLSLLGLCLSISLFAQFESMMGAPSSELNKQGSNVKTGKNFTDAKGWKQGEWEKRTQDGNLIYKATFKDDKPVGILTRYYPSGMKKAVVEYDALGGSLGKAQLFDEKEILFADGFYADNKKDSVWRYIDRFKNVICIESYKNGKHNGKTTFFYQGGSPYEEINYVEDVKEGDWIQYFKGGQVKLKSQYLHGLLVGSFKILFEDGSSEVVGFYKNGKEDGIWRFYLPDGKVDYDIKYKNGQILNADEIDRKKSDRIKQLEKNKNSVKDPEQYRNDPDGYMNGN